MRMVFPFAREYHGNENTGMPKREWEWYKSTRDNWNGNGYFFTCAKIPIGLLNTNIILYYVEDKLDNVINSN